MRLQNKKLIWIPAAIGITLIAGTLVLAFSHTPRPVKTTPPPVKAPVAVKKTLFGLPADSFRITEGTIQRNELLSGILERYGLDRSTIYNLSRKSRPVFDIRKMKAGSRYLVFSSKDSSAKTAYFVYQANPVDYVLYDLRDSIRITTGKRPVTTRVRSVGGAISGGSMYSSLERLNGNPLLVPQLVNIFAWAIDFYHLQEGDWFKIVYEENYVPDGPAGLGNIRSAVFSHDGEKFYAFYFQPDPGKPGAYYNEQAKSLRQAFLKAPLKYSRITSHYTKRRFHPVQHRWKAHLGTDYAAPTGTPIMSTGDGTVIASTYSRFNGNYVKIRHNSTYTTQYLHMSRRAVHAGQRVKQGQVIGYVGSTGLATGPHVCYRFWKNGQQVDALKQHFTPTEPVAAADLPRFDSLMRLQKGKLEDMPLDTAEEEPEEVLASAL